jgi:hypothetical protein
MNAREENTASSEDSFRISDFPIIGFKDSREDENLFADLPRSYGQSIVFAMARDPRTLFVYWDIDWARIFAAGAPADRKVYLRLNDDTGDEATLTPVEPMSRNCNIEVEPGGSYRIELGYFDKKEVWHSVGLSELVQTPTDKMSALATGDFALVPFHVTFQRLTELFRATHIDEGSLVQSLTHLQEKSFHPEQFGALAPEEREIYRAMKASISEKTYLPRRPLDPPGEMRLQKKLESVLGFGASPSSSSLGGSSRV